MPFVFGVHTQFDDPVSVGDPVIAVAAKAIQLAANKGAFYQAMGAPQIGIDTEKFEVYSRSKNTRAGVIGTGGWDNSATVDLPVNADAVKGLTIGHVIEVESEVVIVSAVDRSANTIDVYARGAGGTTAAAHLVDVAFAVIGFAGKDNTLKNVESINETSSAYENYIQTVFEALDWEFKGKNLKRKGMGNDSIVSILTQEASYRVAELLSTMAIKSRKQLGSKGGSPYMSAGLLSQLADSNGGARPVLSYNANGALNETKLRAALKEAFKTGNPNTIWCNTTNKEVINGFNSSLQITIPRTEHVAGQYVNAYDYEGAILEVKIDADIPTSILPIVNQSKCLKGWQLGDGLRTVDEPQASSREFRQTIQGAVGFIIEDVGYEHTYIYGIS